MINGLGPAATDFFKEMQSWNSHSEKVFRKVFWTSRGRTFPSALKYTRPRKEASYPHIHALIQQHTDAKRLLAPSPPRMAEIRKPEQIRPSLSYLYFKAGDSSSVVSRWHVGPKGCSRFVKSRTRKCYWDQQGLLVPSKQKKERPQCRKNTPEVDQLSASGASSSGFFPPLRCP